MDEIKPEPQEKPRTKTGQFFVAVPLLILLVWATKTLFTTGEEWGIKAGAIIVIALVAVMGGDVG